MALLLPEVGLLFWMLLSFGIVFFLVAKFGFPVIIGMVEKRKSYIDDSLKAAEEATEKLSKLKEQAEKIIAKANVEQGKILKHAQEEKNSIILEAQRKAREISQQELENVSQEITRRKEEAIRDIRKQVAILSVDIAEKIIRKDLNKDNAQMAMIDQMLDEVLAHKENK